MIRKEIKYIRKHIDSKEFTILTGARQIGKTTILRQLFDEIKDRPSAFLNLERKDILEDLNLNPENIFKYITVSNDQRAIVFIDEIQYLNDPTHFLKLLFDEYFEKLKIVATGSSAFYIDRDFKDSLAGRKKIFELRTLDFDDFLLLKGEAALHKELMKLRQGEVKKTPLENRLWVMQEEYALYGGYPAVVLDSDIESKKERLRELRDSFMKRDILEAGVNNELKFFQLCTILASQIGSLLNTNELANTLNIAHATIENYLYILQKCFHIGYLRPFHQNLRKELTKMPKIYFNDLGLRNVLLNNFLPIDTRLDRGALLENSIYRKLKEEHPNAHIKFWRTTAGNEVDFMVLEPDEKTGKAYESKFSEKEVKPNKYKIFKESYPQFGLDFIWWGHSFFMA